MMGKATEKGLCLCFPVSSFGEMKELIYSALHAGILRCVSPHREERCEEAATSITWQDEAEWYFCCDRHHDYGAQWLGSTRFCPHDLELLVIPGNTVEDWLHSLNRQDVRREEYDR